MSIDQKIEIKFIKKGNDTFLGIPKPKYNNKDWYLTSFSDFANKRDQYINQGFNIFTITPETWNSVPNLFIWEE